MHHPYSLFDKLLKISGFLQAGSVFRLVCIGKQNKPLILEVTNTKYTENACSGADTRIGAPIFFFLAYFSLYFQYLHK